MEINKIVAAGLGVVLIGSLAWAGVATHNANVNADAVANALSQISAIQADNADLSLQIEQQNANLAQFGVQIEDLNTVIAGNEQVIADYEAELATVNAELETVTTEAELAEATEEAGYDVDEFGLAKTISEDITENDYEKLLDSEVDFDGEDYDFEEVFSFTATSDINGDDYLENTYLVFDEGNIVYKVIFEDDLDTSLIDDDETLKISFLGKEIEIIDWDVDEITMNVGEDFLVNLGETVTYNDKVVTLVFAGEEEVLIDVDGVVDSIKEDKTEEINGLSIKLDFTAEGAMAKLVISDEDAETVIESGDEYAEDSMWEYVIDANSIGLVLAEDLVDIDDDSDFKALAANELVSLPEDYLTLTYNGIKNTDVVDVDFSEKNGFVKIKGDFVSGMDDFELVYANATGFYDEDYNLISTSDIEIDDTDSIIELIGNKLKINDVKLKLDFSDALVNGNSVLNKDDNYRSAYGIIVESPEDNLEDEEFKISVPEEEVEVDITVN